MSKEWRERAQALLRSFWGWGGIVFKRMGVWVSEEK